MDSHADVFGDMLHRLQHLGQRLGDRDAEVEELAARNARLERDLATARFEAACAREELQVGGCRGVMGAVWLAG